MPLQKQHAGIDDQNTPSDLPNFQLPSKTSKSIPIIAPMSNAPDTSHADTTASRNETWTANSSSVSNKTSLSTLSDTKGRSAVKLINNSSETNGDASTYRRGSHKHQPPKTNQSTLDVFTPNYIPLRLRAVNESTADLQPCPAFPAFDFASYIATIVGSDFVQPLVTAAVPPPIHVENSETTLHISNYATYWRSRLQNEFASQQNLYNSFIIYDQKLNPSPGRDNLYIVHVPGLRENTPRVDIGDVVHVRPLHSNHIISEAQIIWWLQYGKHQGIVCPGYTGLLYNPRVWEIDRINEQIMLQMDYFNPNTSCNVIFLLQEQKLEPGCRAVGAPTVSNSWLRSMLFPEVKDGVLQTKLSLGRFDIAWFDMLNWEQKKAVHTIVSNDYGTMPYLISGPPGTGKTKTIVEATLQLIKLQGHLLVCAPSDAAADTLALRLSVQLMPNELFRLNSWTRTFAEVPDRLLLYTYSDGVKFSLPPVQQMLSFKVVVTTCRDADILNHARLTNTSLDGLLNGVQPLLNPLARTVPLHWTALLLDEAAQATEPETLIALSVVIPPTRTQLPQFVAAGDQFQLGPKLLSRSGLEISLFQRLFARCAYTDHPLSRKNGVVAMTSKLLPMMRPAFSNLIRNYRSHPAILSVPSSLFYDDTLITERKTSQDILSWPGWTSKAQWPVLFQQNDSLDAYESVTGGDGTGYGSLHNFGEATIALEIATSLLNHATQSGRLGLSQRDIMIMSPFRAQITLLRKVARKAGLFEINIGPLEAFQGLESRVVIICTTRTRTGSRPHDPGQYVATDKHRSLGLIDEPQKFNVALTRAQEGLIVIGNASCLISTNDNQWLNFLGFCKRNECFSAPAHFKWPDLGSDFRQGRLEKALIYSKLKTHRTTVDGDDKPHNLGDSSSVFTGVTLKGAKQDMDEEMWQLKELVQSYDYEDIDLVLDDYATIGALRTTGSSPSRDLHAEEIVGYDRNLRQEFHDECTAQ